MVDYKQRGKEREPVRGGEWALLSPSLLVFLHHTHNFVTSRVESVPADTLEPSNPVVLMGCGTRNSSSASPRLISDER